MTKEQADKLELAIAEMFAIEEGEDWDWLPEARKIHLCDKAVEIIAMVLEADK